VSDSIAGSGTLDANLHFMSGGSCPTGHAILTQAAIVDSQRQVNLTLGDVELSVPTAPLRKNKTEVACLESTKTAIDLSGGRPLSVEVGVYRWGALVRVSGSAAAENLLASAKSLGLIARDYRASGVVDLDAGLIVEPSHFKEARWTGTASAAKIAFPQGITLRNAVVDLQKDSVSLKQFTTTFPELQSEISGSVQWPLPCDVTPCPARFNLHASTVDLDALNRALNPSFRTRNWFYLPRFLGGKDSTVSPVSVLLVFRGTGRLSVERLAIKKAVLGNVAADVTWDHELLTLANISGGLLNGRLTGNTQVDFTSTPNAQGHIELRDAELFSTAAWLSAPWAKGKTLFSADLSFAGTNGADVMDSLKVEGNFNVKDGWLRHFSSNGDLAFRTWTGKVAYAQRSLQISDSMISTAKGELQLAGKVSKDLALDLQIASANAMYAVGGTLQSPQLTPAASVPRTASNPRNDQLTQKKRDNNQR
jgi:hypothetical protein